MIRYKNDSPIEEPLLRASSGVTRSQILTRSRCRLFTRRLPRSFGIEFCPRHPEMAEQSQKEVQQSHSYGLVAFPNSLNFNVHRACSQHDIRWTAESLSVWRDVDFVVSASRMLFIITSTVKEANISAFRSHHPVMQQLSCRQPSDMHSSHTYEALSGRSSIRVVLKLRPRVRSTSDFQAVSMPFDMFDVQTTGTSLACAHWTRGEVQLTEHA
jgi:hypothetical protein